MTEGSTLDALQPTAGEHRAERTDLGRVASTMMACRDRMEQEQAFLEALRSAERWRVTGSHLELYDAEDRRVARLEARPLE